jgi:hypothetical protein
MTMMMGMQQMGTLLMKKTTVFHNEIVGAPTQMNCTTGPMPPATGGPTIPPSTTNGGVVPPPKPTNPPPPPGMI